MNKLLLEVPEIIETKRLYLKLPKAGFGEKLHRAISDGYKDYIKWLNWPDKIPTAEELEVECRRHHADFILREYIRYLIIDKQTENIIGRCALPDFQANWAIPQFGISYFICESKRSNGYATEATHSLSNIAFKILRAKKLEICCDKENIASNRIPEKLGFKLEYVKRGGWVRPNGDLATILVYSMFGERDLINFEVK